MAVQRCLNAGYILYFESTSGPNSTIFFSESLEEACSDGMLNSPILNMQALPIFRKIPYALYSPRYSVVCQNRPINELIVSFRQSPSGHSPSPS